MTSSNISYVVACSCVRCSAEEKLEGSSVSRDLQGAYEELDGRLKGEVMTAVEEGDMEEVLDLLDQLQSMSRRSENDLRHSFFTSCNFRSKTMRSSGQSSSEIHYLNIMMIPNAASLPLSPSSGIFPRRPAPS